MDISFKKRMTVGIALFIVMMMMSACGMIDQSAELPVSEINEDSLRIAAVGDSITAEYTENAGYPEILDDMLGKDYIVRNFGKSNYAAQVSSDFPYMRTNEYKESLAFNPNLVLLMLGTNDSKNRNWEGPEQFKEEYTALLESYLELESVSRVILASPPTVFVESAFRGAINQNNINPIRDIVAEVAGEYDLEFIDMMKQTANHPEWFFDGIHPTPAGAEQLAQIFYNQI